MKCPECDSIHLTAEIQEHIRYFDQTNEGRWEEFLLLRPRKAWMRCRECGHASQIPILELTGEESKALTENFKTALVIITKTVEGKTKR